MSSWFWLYTTSVESVSPSINVVKITTVKITYLRPVLGALGMTGVAGVDSVGASGFSGVSGVSGVGVGVGVGVTGLSTTAMVRASR